MMKTSLSDSFKKKYDYLMYHKWKQSESNPVDRKEIERKQLLKFGRGSYVWDTFVKKIKEDARDEPNLLKLISFNFENQTFKNLTEYTASTFPFQMIFKECHFESDFILNSCEVVSSFIFINSTFKNKCTLSKCSILSDLQFLLTRFEGDFLISNCEFSENLAFYGDCYFDKKASFVSTKFQKSISFGFSEFKNTLPDLRESFFERSVDLSNIVYSEKNIIKNIYSGDLSLEKERSRIKESISNLNKLKTLAESNGDHRRKLDFFVLSLKASKIFDAFLMRSAINVFNFASDFGRSIKRPLLWIFIITMLSFSISHFYIKKTNVSCGTTSKNELLIAFQNSLPIGIGFNKQNLDCAYGIYGSHGIPPIAFQLFTMFQKVTIYILWFLFILAIRNRFRI